VKTEPRDQASPYLFGGNYRIPQTTPSPTPSIQNPVSPSPMFLQTQVSTSPSPFHHQNHTINPNNTNNPVDSILKNQLQTPQANGNIFQHPAHTNQMYTPNIPAASNYQIDNAMWATPANGRINNNNNFNNVPMTSQLFNNQNLTPLTPVQNFSNTSNINNNNNNNNNEYKSNFSSLLDLDSQQLLAEQMLNNLSGELKNLSFGDYSMESFSNKQDNNNDKINNIGSRKEK
jgi:hypothetical protein